MSMYPDNLLYFVKKLSGYSRNNVKVLPLTSTTSGNGQVVQFRLPTNSLIDLSTWCVHGRMAVEGDSANKAAFGRDTASMIRNVQIQVGGQTIQNLNQYNLVWQALKQLTMSPQTSNNSSYLEFDSPPLVPSADQKPGTGDGVPFVIRQWLGFFQASPSIIDTSLLGEIVVSLTIETDRFLYSVADSSNVAVTLTLKQLFGSIDLISIQDGVYDMVAQQALASGLMLEIPVPNYFTFQGASTTGSAHSQRFTIGCQSLDAAMILQRKSGLTTGADSAPTANGYVIQKGLRFSGEDCASEAGSGWYFEVNGAQVPSHRVSRDDTFHYQKVAFGVHGADHANLIGYANNADSVVAASAGITGENASAGVAISITEAQLNSGLVKTKSNALCNIRRAADTASGLVTVDADAILENQWIPVVRFNHAASDKRLLSGIDARSNPVQIAYNGSAGGNKLVDGNAYTAVTNMAVSVVALCTSTLMVGAGQQLSFSA